MWLVIVFWLVLGGVREVREVTDRVACLAARLMYTGVCWLLLLVELCGLLSSYGWSLTGLVIGLSVWLCFKFSVQWVWLLLCGKLGGLFLVIIGFCGKSLTRWLIVLLPVGWVLCSGIHPLGVK